LIRPTKAQESKLAAQARRGSTDAANTLILSVYKLIRKIAKTHAQIRNGITRFSPIDAADLASEYVVFMYDRLPHFKPSRARLTTFTSMCLRHWHCKLVRRDLSSLKARSNAEVSAHTSDEEGKPAQVFDRLPGPDEPPTDHAERNEMTAVVQKALKRLPALQAAIVVDYYWHEKTAKQIGAERGFSKQRALQVIHDAVGLLAERLHAA
jgi:RNA polymerase sigma factor (sigma-70 family)